MASIELTDEDREKYGAPERIEFTYGRFGLKSIDALETEAGWTLEDLGNGLRRKKCDEHGNVVTRDELDDNGNPILDEAGNPKQVDVLNPSMKALAAVVWLALRGAGIRVPWDDFDVQAEVRINWDDEGKAEKSED